jgi:nifR3 family TIM-barrel protein
MADSGSRASCSLAIGDVQVAGRILLAPMTGVSDLPFRRAASKLGAAYVATEMVACDLLARGRPDMVRRAAVGDGLPLMVVQLVGREPHWVAKAVVMAEAAGAQIIDLNMGCPAKEVTGALSGSALMRDLELAERLIAAAVGATTLPVTLKMRLGWDDASKNAPELAALAERAGIRAITVHGRTRQQFYNGVADWRAVADVKAATSVPVIVNGDVTDAQTARVALAQSGADAVMVGRGAYGRPWIATAIDQALQTGRAVAEPGLAERLAIVVDHLGDSLRHYGDALGMRVFRKHLGWYVENAPLPVEPERRHCAKSALCRLATHREVETALISLWQNDEFKSAA